MSGSSDAANGANKASAGEKHDLGNDKGSEQPDAKRTKTDASEDGSGHQQTLEETLSKAGNSDSKEDAPDATEPQAKDDKKDEDTAAKEEPDDSSKSTGTAVKPHADPDVPSTILEKGIIYFFFRPRVNVEHPEEVDDIARTYIILRPMAPDAALGSGPIGDSGNSRVLAIPKKTFPRSGRERYMVFVNRSGASFKEIKEQFLEGEKRETKTKGTSVVPEAVPAAEGVYMITSTGRDSHLAYAITLPKDLGEVQQDLGLKKKGSFILSTKNPKYPGPQGAQLPQAPDFSEDILAEFRDLRWTGTRPAHLDYVNAQLLFVGESKGIENATQPRKKDQKEGKEEPEEVLEELEEEDLERMKNLSDTDAVYKDLEVRAVNYPDLMTTF